MNNLNTATVDISLNRYLSKQFNKGKYKREQPEEVQLKKIALAEQKRERKALAKQKRLPLIFEEELPFTQLSLF